MKPVTTPYSHCLLGIVTCDVTPPVGIYHRMWGAARHDQATGVHRPMMASVLAFGDDELLSIIVAIDLCVLLPPEGEQLLDTIATHPLVKRERIAINCSHTHGSGFLTEARAHLPGGELIAPYLEKLNNSIRAAVDQAIAERTNVTISYGKGYSELAQFRDGYDSTHDQRVCGFCPDVEADHTIVLARVTSMDGELMAMLVNYGCHPTTLAWDNTLISPDFVGKMRETVTAALGAPTVFLQGACGELGPLDGFVGDPAVADRNGEQLAYGVLAGVTAMGPPNTAFCYDGFVESGTAIATWSHHPLEADALAVAGGNDFRRLEVPLPYRELPTREEATTDRDHWKQRESEARQRGEAQQANDCRAMVERLNRILTRLEYLPEGTHYQYPVHIWRWGQGMWVAVESEPYSVIQQALRSRYPEFAIVMMVLVNSTRVTYLPPRESSGLGIYQDEVGVLAEGALETLIAAIADAIDEMLADTTAPV